MKKNILCIMSCVSLSAFAMENPKHLADLRMSMGEFLQTLGVTVIDQLEAINLKKLIEEDSKQTLESVSRNPSLSEDQMKFLMVRQLTGWWCDVSTYYRMGLAAAQTLGIDNIHTDDMRRVAAWATKQGEINLEDFSNTLQKLRQHLKPYICHTCQQDVFQRNQHAMARFSHCSRCKDTYYCGRECQSRDWPKHKKVCK